MAQIKVGMVMLSDGKSRPQPMRLQLTGTMLLLQKEESNIIILNKDDETEPPDTRERLVKIKRQNTGGLGLSIKGGAEHKLPILVSRIFKDQAADQTGQLFVGDVILKVNDVSLDNVNHDAGVNILRSAGDVVSLTVIHHRGVSPFLSKSLKRTKGENINDGEETNNKKRAGNIPQSDAPPTKSERKWTDVMTINLLMAYLTRYMLDTDKLRPNAFEIRAQEGKPSAVIHCDDAGMLSEWIKHISNNIIHLTNQQVKMLNKSFPPNERAYFQVFYLGWLAEGCSAPQPWYKWRPKFVTLRGSEIYLFDAPPKSSLEYNNCPSAYKIYQCMMKCLKESEFADDRQNCFLLQTGNHESRYISAESRAVLLRFEAAWHRATYHAVTKLGSKTFSVIHLGRTGGLTLDWIMGFALYDTEEKEYAWKYKFSQLKGSSDDGKKLLKLVFQDTDNNIAEIKELECTHLANLLYCMHAFLTAKLASVDPGFLRNSC